MVEEYIKLYAERSDNWLAEDLGTTDMTVKAQRDELEQAGQVPKLGTSRGKDGKAKTPAHHRGVLLSAGFRPPWGRCKQGRRPQALGILRLAPSSSFRQVADRRWRPARHAAHRILGGQSRNR